ncbi:hypothetical protein JD499_03085 [Aeromonas enteropelogenes]|uniref:hypothetical protein n=1 Tax=Aeromonas enteropelogenes TaxID=29489 RepID=UPI00191FDB3F|nr:hypothetical protein [Aeromonas enteropelogenes]MBL0456199.1 hypothetical protein [Aeromonas enteropelogenes]
MLEKSTCEILDYCQDSSVFPVVLQQALEFIKCSGFEYIQARVEHIREKRHALENAGFYYAEMSYELSFKNPKAHTFVRDLSNRLLLLPVQSQHDVDFIKAIAHDNFKHGRMLEDLNVDYPAAQQRMANWIDVLAKHPYELFIVKCNERNVGFHAQHPSADGQEVHWILTGTCSEYSMLSVPLWQSAFKLAQNRNVKSINTVISAANIGVLNLYNSFPFRVDRALCGYHLIINT